MMAERMTAQVDQNQSKFRLTLTHLTVFSRGLLRITAEMLTAEELSQLHRRLFVVALCGYR
jgi:hypothetical protein